MNYHNSESAELVPPFDRCHPKSCDLVINENTIIRET